MIKFYEREDGTVRLVHGTRVAHSFRMHTHHSLSVGLIVRGQRFIGLRGSTLWAGPGSVFIIQPSAPHACYSDQPTGHDYWILSFSRDFLQSFCRENNGNELSLSHLGTKVLRDPILYQEVLNFIFSWMASSSRNFIKDEHRFLAFLLRCGAEKETMQTEVCVSHHLQKTSAIQKIKVYIEQHLAEEIRLADLGQLAGLNPFYLNRLFREQIGIPPHAYQIQERIKKAQRLLKKGIMPAETALETGFADQSHFHRFFKKCTGITPGQYARAI